MIMTLNTNRELYQSFCFEVVIKLCQSGEKNTKNTAKLNMLFTSDLTCSYSDTLNAFTAALSDKRESNFRLKIELLAFMNAA